MSPHFFMSMYIHLTFLTNSENHTLLLQKYTVSHAHSHCEFRVLLILCAGMSATLSNIEEVRHLYLELRSPVSSNTCITHMCMCMALGIYKDPYLGLQPRKQMAHIPQALRSCSPWLHGRWLTGWGQNTSPHTSGLCP